MAGEHLLMLATSAVELSATDVIALSMAVALHEEWLNRRTSLAKEMAWLPA